MASDHPKEHAGARSDDRPLPFVLRVAAEWIDFQDITELDDGTGYFIKKGHLTGALSVTSDGRDVTFTDIGVRG